MFIYGKTSANAIAVMSFLAAEPKKRAGSGEIAKARGISRALTAKLLTQLAAAGLVSGQPGPGGGYTLAKPARTICLLDIASLFEQIEPPSLCPFGHDWCGKGDPCPLHNMISGMIDSNRSFMKKTSLAIFDGKFPQLPATASRRKKKECSARLTRRR
ncbi:MAG: Rrf2 family transcriptional regulator [Terrimicrobiaceae bacterium]